MKEFRQLLDAHMRGQAGLEEVARALRESIGRQAGLSASHGALIEALYRGERLSSDSYSALMRQINALQPPAVPKSAPRVTVGPDTTILRGARPRQGGESDRTQLRGQQGHTDTTGASSWSDPARWTPTSTEPLGPGSILKDRFVLEQKIGHGGMGTVYRARDRRKEEAHDRNPYVAIKVLNEDFKRHPRSLQALQREARKAQALAHPNIVTVYDFDRDGTNVFMVMELLQGEPLDSLIKRHKGIGLDPAQAWYIALELCKGMSYAHERGIVHADFKPANAFLLKDGSVKIFDFGIARAVKLGTRGAGVATVFDPGTLGALTPAYASRDVALGLDPESSDDVYAIACVIYELLTGSHPFNRLSADIAGAKGLKAARPVDIPWRRWRALRNALEFGRGGRPATAKLLLDALSARPRPALLYASVAVAAAAIVVTGVMLFRSHLMARDEMELTKTLAAGDEARIEASLPELRSLAADRRAAIFLDDAARAGLIRHFQVRIDAAVDATQGRYDYPRAEQLLADLTGFFADSQAVKDISDRLSARKTTELARQIGALDASLQSGVLIDRQGPFSVTSVLGILRAVDPSNALLVDAKIPAAFAAQARVSLDRGDLDLAVDLIAAGLAVDPGDPSLVALDKDVRVAQTRASDTALASAQPSPLSRVPTPGSTAPTASSTERLASRGPTPSQTTPASNSAASLASSSRASGPGTATTSVSAQPLAPGLRTSTPLQASGGVADAANPADLSTEQLRERLTAGITAPGQTIARVRSLAAMAAELERRRAPGAAELKRSLKLRVAGDIAAIRQRNGIEDATRFAETMVALFPDSPVLTKSLADLRLASTEAVAKRRENDLAQTRNNLAALLDARRLDDSWPAAVEAQLQRLATFLPADDPSLTEINRGVAGLYLTRAGQLREAKRLTEAQRMMERARALGAPATALAAEEKLFAQAFGRVQADVAERERLARIEALKQKLLAHAQANDVSAANATLKELREALPKQDKFLTDEAPAAIARSYVRQASAAAREMRLRDAIDLVDRGRAVSRTAADFTRIRNRYLRYSEIVNDVSDGPLLNVDRISRDLASFAAEDFDEQAAVARWLMQKLVNRSNTERDRDFARRLTGIARQLNDQQTALRKEKAT